MAKKSKPLKPNQKPKQPKLNPLQKRTLTLLQVLARDPGAGRADAATGEVTISSLPHAHGDHVHVGAFSVSRRDASGLSNEAVWVALERKGLARSDYPLSITLTPAGLEFDTGLLDDFEQSDH